MHIRARLFTAALCGALLLALGAGTATASRSFSVVGGGRAIRATSETGGLTFAGENGVNVISDVTLSGSIHPLIAKAAGSLVGVITRVETANCRTNLGIECAAIGLPPMHLRLVSFTGTLPRIAGVTLSVAAGFRIELARGRPNCLYTGTVPAVSAGTRTETSYTVQRLTAEANTNTLLRGEGEEFFRRCPRTGELVGSFRLSPEVTLRLH